MRRALLLSLSLVTLAACGSEPPPEPEDPNRTCAGYGPAHDCMNPDVFEQCRTFEAQCPGQVQVQETCPFQFSCPSGE